MIDKNTFLTWAKQKLGNPIESGQEIRFNSIWTEDQGHHLYCNLHGGKRKIESGVFQCWKTQKKGTIIKLVMEVDKCSFVDALYILGLKTGPRPIEQFEEEVVETATELSPDTFKILSFPEGVIPFNFCNNNYLKQIFKNYLSSRSFNSDFFYIGVEGKYKNRVIIPYYDDKKNLIYYNGRSLLNSKLRYLGPSKEIGVGKSDVIFMYKWFNNNDKIYLCEGEFDSMSLNMCGLIGCAVGGKFVSLKQATILANKKICLAFDNDEAGQSAIDICKKTLEGFGCTVSKVCPPNNIKDWNEFLVKYGSVILRAYIDKSEEQL